MQQLNPEIQAAFERRLNQANVPAPLRPAYHKWLRFYLLFCEKFLYSPGTPTSLGPFLTRLAARNQSIEHRRLAATVVRLFLGREPQQPPDPHNLNALKPLTGQPLLPFQTTPPGRGTSWEQEY